MALLQILWTLREEYDLYLAVAHVNHSLRGKEALEDQKLVEKECLSKGIPFQVLTANVKKYAGFKNISIEEAGREIRYKYFTHLKKSFQITKTATGHHMDDNVETVIMRILRGTGIKGLKGIEALRDDGVIRPLLGITKEEILKFCKSENVRYRDDATNFEKIYHRNSIRLDLIPVLKKYNPAIENSIINLTMIAKEYEECIDEIVSKIWCGFRGKKEIEIAALEKYPLLVQKELLLRKIKESDDSISIQYVHINAVMDKLRDSMDTVWQLSLPGGVKIRRVYGILMIGKSVTKDSIPYFQYTLLPDKVYILPRLGRMVTVSVVTKEKYLESSKKSNEKFFDYDKMVRMKCNIIMRQRKIGDRIRPLGMKASKKIKEILIDKKVPADLRDKIPVFQAGEEIFWLYGYTISEQFKVSETTDKVLCLSVENFEEEKYC
ncbi:MAG: tRNA lysidine(34) synthetase TilS [Eubacteriaceae bacterium]|nr:tRNA lysidine(34) synthetase TilS [Eubacteriaceae bacterium]